jgi:hypothetical protein
VQGDEIRESLEKKKKKKKKEKEESLRYALEMPLGLLSLELGTPVMVEIETRRTAGGIASSRRAG